MALAKKWGVNPGEPVPLWTLKTRAAALVRELLFWNLCLVRDPAKKKARDKLVELRCEIQEALDVLAPGWEKELPSVDE